MNSIERAITRGQPDFRLWAKYVNNPVGFVRHVVGAYPEPAQCVFMMNVAIGPNIRTVVKSCHGAGKTACLAWLILWFICTRPFPRIACTAPTEHQLHDKLWPELHKWYRKSKGELWRFYVWEKTRFYLREHQAEWFAVARVARVTKTNASVGAEALGMQGFHEEHMLIIVDEGSGVHDAVYGTLEGALSTGSDVHMAVAGNPNIPSGWYYDAFKKNKAIWNTQTISYTDSARVKNSWAEDLIETFGLGHPWVQVKVLGEFPDMFEHGLFSIGMLESAMNRRLEPTGIRTLGIDVARYGDARTVFAMADGGDVQTISYYSNLGVDEVALEAEYVAKELKVKYVVVDADGVGAGTVDTLKKLLRGSGIRLVEWNGGVAALKPMRYRNARTELNWKIKECLVTKEIALPENDALIRQASAYRYEFDGVGRIVLATKKIISKLIGESPDELDAVGYSLVPFLYPNAKIPTAKGKISGELVF